MTREPSQSTSSHRSWHHRRVAEPAARAGRHKIVFPEESDGRAARAHLGGLAAPRRSAVSIPALISDTTNRVYRLQSIPEEETIGEENKLRADLGFEKEG
jgi:hypothetical protein